MSGITGGGDKGTSGNNAPFNFGVSPFDLSSILTAMGLNTEAIGNRYEQLGLGGSTMEGQDIAGANQQGEALTGQLQTANVGNPALNPALQSTQPSSGSDLSSLAKAAGTAASLAP